MTGVDGVLKNRIAAFLNGRDGTIAVETVLAMPVLCWLYVASVVWFDAYRIQTVNLKATYTVSDMVSRETESIDQSYFDGLETIYAYLVHNRFPTGLRVSTIECTGNCADDASRTLEVCWSQASSGYTALTTEALAAFNAVTPTFNAGDTLIMTETFLDYAPAFNVGLDARTFENVIFTRPRLAGQVKFETDEGMLDCFSN